MYLFKWCWTMNMTMLRAAYKSLPSPRSRHVVARGHHHHYQPPVVEKRVHVTHEVWSNKSMSIWIAWFKYRHHNTVQKACNISLSSGSPHCPQATTSPTASCPCSGRAKARGKRLKPDPKYGLFQMVCWAFFRLFNWDFEVVYLGFLRWFIWDFEVVYLRFFSWFIWTFRVV